MKTAIYPGSFNPWHKGHEDVLKKAFGIFDYVQVVVFVSPEKKKAMSIQEVTAWPLNGVDEIKYSFCVSDKALVAFLKENEHNHDYCAIIRGLRNGNDLQYEMNQQYWNEDVGIKIPFVYFITDRKLSHVSSSAIREVANLGLSHGY